MEITHSIPLTRAVVDDHRQLTVCEADSRRSSRLDAVGVKALKGRVVTIVEGHESR